MREERNKGRWRRRNSEKSSLQSVKGQQPTLWFHLASSLSVCVCARVCVCVFERVEECQRETWPRICVCVCKCKAVNVCFCACTCLFVCVWLQVHASVHTVSVWVCVCDVNMKASTGPLALQCVSLPDLYTYSETSQWGHICGSDDTWNTRSCLVSGWKTSTWLFELCCLEICLVKLMCRFEDHRHTSTF